MPQFADRVKTTSTSTGSSAITLSSSGATGYQAFPSSLDGETVGYVIEASGGTDWEIGTGVYTHSTLGLSRTLRSSSTGSLLNLGSGTHTVFLTPAAQDIQIVEAFSSTSDLPSASDNHGRIYHVHGEGAMYFAHSGSWVKLANYSDITTYSNATTSSAGLMSAADKTKLDGVEASADVTDTTNVVAALTAGTNITIASDGTISSTASGGGGSSTSALTETTFAASANQTAFIVSGGITNAANVSVFQNGVKLEEGSSKDYTVNASTDTVTLNSGAAASDVVEVLEFGQPNSITDLSDTPSSLGTAGQTLVVNSGGTALEFGAASGGGGMTVYNDLNGTDGTPSGYTYLTNASSPSNGDLAFVTANNTVYVRAASGWRKIATVQEAPSTVTGHSASYPDIGEDATTDITLSTTDPEGFDVTWSYVVGGNGTLSGSNINNSNGDTLASIAVQTANSNSGGTNTITYRITRETTSINGDFTITFTATDSQSTGTSDTGAISFEISFIISDSRYTTLLMAADGPAGGNSTITYDTGSSTGNSLTVAGDAHAGTFSPYRHGGYSLGIGGGTGDYLQLSANAGFSFGTGNFTVEAWVYLPPFSNTNGKTLFDARPTTTNGSYWLFSCLNTNIMQFTTMTSGGTSVNDTVARNNQWVHYAAVREGTSLKLFANGTLVDQETDSSNISSSGLRVGGNAYQPSVSEALSWPGYIADARIVKGTAVYTGNFTPPSGPLTTTGGTYPSTTNVNTSITSGHTKLLIGHLPHIADGSSSTHSITVNGNPSIKPFGPHDHSEYDESDNGGSIYFDGNGDYLGTPNITMLAADQTVEFWAWHEGTDGDGVLGSISDNSFVITLDTRKPTIWVNSQTLTNISGYTISDGFTATGNAAVSNGWHHYAYDINVGASTTTLITYVDGAVYGSLSWANTSLTARGVGRGLTSPYERYFVGYISDLRVVNSRVYSGAFTPPTGPLTTTGGTYPSTTNVDTSITASNTSLLLKCTDAHVIDKSQNYNLKLFNDAASTDALTSNSTPPYIGAAWANTSAVSFDGVDDYINLGTAAIPTPYNEDYTFEFWMYPTSLSRRQSPIAQYAVGQDGRMLLYLNTNGSIEYYQNGLTNSGYISSSSGLISINNWYHVAVSNSNGGTRSLYVDGDRIGTMSGTQDMYNGNTTIGMTPSQAYDFTGYIQDLRITKGLARYTAADESSNIPSAPLKG